MTLGEYLDSTHPNNYYLSSKGINLNWNYDPKTQTATKRNGTEVKIRLTYVSSATAKRHAGKSWQVKHR